MTQEQYVIIVKCIQHGAPVLSEELITSLNGIINTCKMYEQKEKLAKEQAQDEKKEEQKSEVKKGE